MVDSQELRWPTDESAEVAAFGVVTAGAGPREVARLRGSAVFAADDVVHLTTPEGVILVDETIFADVIGAFGDRSAQPFAHFSGHEPEAGGHGLWPAA